LIIPFIDALNDRRVIIPLAVLLTWAELRVSLYMPRVTVRHRGSAPPEVSPETAPSCMSRFDSRRSYSYGNHVWQGTETPDPAAYPLGQRGGARPRMGCSRSPQPEVHCPAPHGRHALG